MYQELSSLRQASRFQDWIKKLWFKMLKTRIEPWMVISSALRFYQRRIGLTIIRQLSLLIFYMRMFKRLIKYLWIVRMRRSIFKLIWLNWLTLKIASRSLEELGEFLRKWIRLMEDLFSNIKIWKVKLKINSINFFKTTI
jgi:hypothetical protein